MSTYCRQSTDEDSTVFFPRVRSFSHSYNTFLRYFWRQRQQIVRSWSQFRHFLSPCWFLYFSLFFLLKSKMWAILKSMWRRILVHILYALLDRTTIKDCDKLKSAQAKFKDEILCLHLQMCILWVSFEHSCAISMNTCVCVCVYACSAWLEPQHRMLDIINWKFVFLIKSRIERLPAAHTHT